MSASNKQKDIQAQRQLVDDLQSSLKFMASSAVDGTNWMSRDTAGKMMQTYIPACSHLRPVFKQLTIEHGQEELVQAQRKLQMMLGADDEH